MDRRVERSFRNVTGPSGIALLLLWLTSLVAAQPAPPKHVEQRCEPSATIPVSNGAYIVQNGEWNSAARSCLSSDGAASFTVTASAIDNPINGAPGGFPSIFQGCHWGTCTAINPFPIQVAALQHERANWNATSAAGVWDQTFDLWFATRPSMMGHPDGAELMIVLRAAPGQGFPGSKVGSLTVQHRRYDVWFAAPPQTKVNFIAYVSTAPQTKVSGFDLRRFIRDALRRGYLDSRWYQLSVEAGFEIWKGGAGLRTNSFSVDVK